MPKITPLKKVQDFLSRANELKSRKESECNSIQTAYEDQFSVSEPNGTKVLEGSVLFQTFWRTITRAKPLNFYIRNRTINPVLNEAIRMGISKALKDGGYLSQLTKPKGAYQKQFLFGDAFVQFGTDPDGELPIMFNVPSIRNVWIDPFADVIRDFHYGKGVQELAVLEEMPLSRAKKLFGKNIEKGRFPMKPQERYDREYKDRRSEQYEASEMTDIMYYYNLYDKQFVIFAGAEGTVIKKLEGEKYPFIDENTQENIIPVSKRTCFPSIEQIYDYGIGHLFYRLHVAQRQNDNMGLSAARDRVDPIQLIPMGKGNIKSFINWMGKAAAMRKAGKKSFIPLETDSAGREKFGKAQSLFSEGMGNEYERINDRLDMIIKRAGINLDDLTHPAQDTARHAIIRQELSDSFVQQIQEFNSAEDRFIIEQTMIFVRDFLDKGSKYYNAPVAGDLTIKTGSDEITLDEMVRQSGMGDRMTMGIISKLLQEHDLSSFMVDMDVRSGTYPSKSTMVAEIDETMPTLNPESKAFKKLAVNRARLLGQSIAEEDVSLEKPDQAFRQKVVEQ